MKINVNKNCDMKSYDILVGDRINMYGVSAVCELPRCINAGQELIFMFEYGMTHWYTSDAINVMLANGLEVLREVEPKKVEIIGSTHSCYAMCMTASTKEIDKIRYWPENTRVKITVEEVLNGTEGS